MTTIFYGLITIIGMVVVIWVWEKLFVFEMRCSKCGRPINPDHNTSYICLCESDLKDRGAYVGSWFDWATPFPFLGIVVLVIIFVGWFIRW